MRSLLSKKDKIYRDFCIAVFALFKQRRYGITTSGDLPNLQRSAYLKEIVDWECEMGQQCFTGIRLWDYPPMSWGVGINSYNKVSPECKRSFEFVQTIASTTWTILHNLGYVPNVYTIDTDGNEISGVIEILDMNNIKILFSSAIAGKAYLS